MKKKYIILIAVFVLGASIYWYTSSHKTSQQVQYVTQNVEKGTLTKAITASGNVVVDQQSTVDPTISGTVADLAVNVGDSVKKGQFLFNIINDDLDVDVANANTSYLQARNAIDSAELSVKEAKADYDAAKKDDTKTSKQKKVMKSKIAIAENSLALTNAQFSANKISYSNVLDNSSKRKVTSPIAGTVNEINIKNGDDLGKDSSSSTTTSSPMIIGDLGVLKASVSVNEVDMPGISLGQKATLQFDAIDSLITEGEVEKIDSLGTSTQGVVTYTVTIKMASLDQRIMPKMSVTASIVSESKDGVMIVPTTAISKQGDSASVQVLGSGNMIEKRSVKIGMSNDTDTEIVSGLSVVDKIVTETIDTSSSADSTSSADSKQSTSGLSSLSGGGGPPSGGAPPQ